MKLSSKLTRCVCGMLCALTVLPTALTGCNKTTDPLYYRYNYDLSEYIDLAQYNGVPAVYTDAVITDEDVEMEVQSTLAYYASEEDIDTGAAPGNIVYFAADVTLNGATVDEYCAEETSLTLGFATYGEAIDEALTGAKAGDVIEAARTLPNTDAYDEYAGETLSYKITVERVCNAVVPELTDLFVQTMLNFDSVDAYREAVREALTEAAASNRSALLLSQVWPTVLEGTVVKKYPEKELGEIRDQVNREIDAYLNAAGINRAEYLKIAYGKTEEEFDTYLDELAKEQVKDEMIVYAIARAENIEATDEEYTQYAQIYADKYGYATVEEMETAFGKDVVRAAVLSDVTKLWVADHASVSES
ncbi:MAG: hypothetical protein SOZ09_07265 [Eubacteriales bacterium]|nr:hypothetical protein [Clostridiales bacterium]MDY3941767.1 hypothetical protein [Eubacteriales bacterium]